MSTLRRYSCLTGDLSFLPYVIQEEWGVSVQGKCSGSVKHETVMGGVKRKVLRDIFPP